jgi:hypothetical protein
MYAFTVMPLYTICWFSCHYPKLMREAKAKLLAERRAAKEAALRQAEQPPASGKGAMSAEKKKRK